MNNESIGIILAGGIGSRFQGNKPKQYYQINGREMISYSIDAFKNASLIDDFIVIVDEAEYTAGRIRDTYKVKTVKGGATRNHSLKNALNYIKDYFPNCKKIIENNAACPLITSAVINDIIALLDENDFVQCTYKITDALGSYTERNVNRDDYFLIQSPDAYRFDLLFRYFDADHPNGHPAVQLPETAKGYNYFGFQPNIKVTYPIDLIIAEMILNGKYNTEE